MGSVQGTYTGGCTKHPHSRATGQTRTAQGQGRESRHRSTGTEHTQTHCKREERTKEYTRVHRDVL